MAGPLLPGGDGGTNVLRDSFAESSRSSLKARQEYRCNVVSNQALENERVEQKRVDVPAKDILG